MSYLKIKIHLYQTHGAVLVCLASFAHFTSTASIPQNIEEDRQALKGYDAVAYFDGMAQKGNASYSFIFEDVRYQFSSNDTLERFKKSPRKFLPAYGGYCAYAMLEGERVDINPKAYKVINSKLYLYYDGLFGDTLKKWNRLLEQRSESSLIQQADEQWKQLQTPSASRP